MGDRIAKARNIFELEKLMAEVSEMVDEEAGHIFADAILCKAIRLLSYDSLVDKFEKVMKWYA